MANKILILGESGQGKSTSVESLNPEETFLINVIGKRLPFKGWKSKYQNYDTKTQKGNVLSTYNHDHITKCIEAIGKTMPHIKNIVVDDSQYIMSYEYMDRATETGFTKFTEIAKHMLDVFKAPDSLRDDLTVFYLAHTEDVSANGFTKTKIKTIGKLLDEKITVEGLFTVVLLAVSFKEQDGVMAYRFVTKNNGTTTVKSPAGMFKEAMIPNDLQYVLDKINEYDN